MDATWIIASFVIIDTMMERMEHHSDVRVQVPDSEIITIAVVAAKYFANHHECAVQVMQGCGYLFLDRSTLYVCGGCVHLAGDGTQGLHRHAEGALRR